MATAGLSNLCAKGEAMVLPEHGVCLGPALGTQMSEAWPLSWRIPGTRGALACEEQGPGQVCCPGRPLSP